MEEFDIVIPIGPNDIKQINEQLNYTKKNIIGYRKIFLISFDPNIQLKSEHKDIIIIDETIFPFSINDVTKFHYKHSRNGWYLQQLLKLYSGLIIPDITEKYLVIDSDTFFLKPTKFIENEKCLYNLGTEYHIPYFEHMKKLHSSLIKKIDFSGICHHMMFEKTYIRELFDLVEKNHSNEPFWKIFLKIVEKQHYGENIYNASGASEYEIYFNFMMIYHNDKIDVRLLKWTNSNVLIQEKTDNYDYISCQWYLM
jgi:hypothetical protein